MGVIVDTAQVDPRRRAELLRDRLSLASSDYEVRFLAHAPFRYERPGTGTAQILQIERSAAHVTAEQVQDASRSLQSSSLAYFSAITSSV